MHLEKYIVPTIFPDHLPDAARMISHETMKNALRPKNHHGFEHARIEDDRQWPIVTDWHLTRRNPAPTSAISNRIFRASWERRSTRLAKNR